MNENLKGFLSFLKALAIIAGATAVVVVGSTLLFCHLDRVPPQDIKAVLDYGHEFGAAPTVEAFDVGAQIYHLVEIADSVNQDYKKLVYDCDDMSVAFWKVAIAEGYEVKLVCGDVEKKVETIREANHAWVWVGVQGEWLAIEVVGGYPVFDDELYYYGWTFDTPQQLYFWLHF